MQRVLDRVGEGTAGLWTLWVFKRERAGKEMTESSPPPSHYSQIPGTAHQLSPRHFCLTFPQPLVLTLWPQPCLLATFILTVSLPLEQDCLNPLGECSLLLVCSCRPQSHYLLLAHADSQDASVPLLTSVPDAQMPVHSATWHQNFTSSTQSSGFPCPDGLLLHQGKWHPHLCSRSSPRVPFVFPLLHPLPIQSFCWSCKCFF